MGMTRKHYVLIAEAIAASACDQGLDREQAAYDAARQECARNIASALKRDNPAFKSAKFLNACNLE